MELQHNPDVSIRMAGVMEKCTFCIQRIKRCEGEATVENRPWQDGDIKPACVQSCPAEAMVFGDLNDPESKVSRLAESSRATRLLEELGTKPKVFYLQEAERNMATLRQSVPIRRHTPRSVPASCPAQVAAVPDRAFRLLSVIAVVGVVRLGLQLRIGHGRHWPPAARFLGLLHRRFRFLDRHLACRHSDLRDSALDRRRLAQTDHPRRGSHHAVRPDDRRHVPDHSPGPCLASSTG